MPDISLLVDIAEFFNVSIPEIINGERKSETILVVALQPYAALAAVDEVLLVLVFLVERSQLVGTMSI